MNVPKQKFGGNWTGEKLERVRNYLVAYSQIMNKQRFDGKPVRYAYIDAFAGTGYNTSKIDDEATSTLFSELVHGEAVQFIDGSARIALKIEPRFTKYIFIEKSPKRVAELKKLKEEFPLLANDITIEKSDANTYLDKLCKTKVWTNNRAVVFLDPFGMQVMWSTMKAIANTKAIDLWILFPLGVAVNRLLRRDANISAAWQKRLNDFFGTTDWREAFYHTSSDTDLFGDTHTRTEKVADFNAISRYFVARLKTIFPGVAPNPLRLCNSANTPLYLLCFAAANPRGAKLAVRIAQHVLKP
jgi:three-Cys-motif partner protein